MVVFYTKDQACIGVHGIECLVVESFLEVKLQKTNWAGFKREVFKEFAAPGYMYTEVETLYRYKRLGLAWNISDTSFIKKASGGRL